MAISCHTANCCKEQSSNIATSQHPSNIQLLADRSLNKITFKFNCKCILSVGFAAAAATPLMVVVAVAAGAVNCNHVAHFSLAARSIDDAGLLQSNVIIFAIYTFSWCFCCSLQHPVSSTMAAPSNLQPASCNKLLSILPFEPEKAAPGNRQSALNLAL